jgi:hypothetical protein
MIISQRKSSRALKSSSKYTQSEAQQIVDNGTGLFLCHECCRTYSNHPSPPSKTEYTLKLLDNTYEINKAMNDMRRVRVQLSSKTLMLGGGGGSGGQAQATTIVLRPGIFDLLQKVRSSTNSNNSNNNNNAKGGGGSIPGDKAEERSGEV